jgi:tRNA/tmRNA/rRNA uracil-C5-methylase (TrmA/RlmC/RlmD family)
LSRPPRPSRGRSLVGEQYDVTLGPVAHGGHMVARHEGRVIFVRHGLPGERVTVRITEGEEHSRFLRGDAVTIASASPDRVPAPCPFSGPDACGGCDFQHVALDAQRELKGQVVREQLRRLAGLPAGELVDDLTVEAVPGDDHGLRWRTRVRFATTPSGQPGLRKHRSHEVVPVTDCLITRTDARTVVEGAAAVEPSPAAEPSRVIELVETTHGSHSFEVSADGFWQVHPGAPRVLVETVLEMLDPSEGERCLDLYAGVGLFTAFLADAVGRGGAVHAVEGDRAAVTAARRNLASYSEVSVYRDRVDRWLARVPEDRVDLVVLDPPREGAKRKVVEGVTARRPRAVAYVACDPAALARDVGLFAERGYRLIQLRAFDLFPMTGHVECVALLERTDSALQGSDSH